MAGFLRMCAAVCAWPLVWAFTRATVDVFTSLPGPADAFLSSGAFGFLVGFAVFLVMWVVLPRPARVYVLGHELTHAVWGLCFGARVWNLRVSAENGSVSLSKSNVWITLAPYFFPFYTILAVLVALTVRLSCGYLPMPPVWMGLVGFTWCFHLCFTISTLMHRQPDVQEYGRLFSWTLIWLFNTAGVLLWIVCASDATVAGTVRQIASRTVRAYAGVWECGCGIVHSLSVLQN